MLQNWLDFAVKADDMHIICVLHAHIAYLHFHYPLHEHTRQSITMLLASQIILNSRHTFNISIPTAILDPEEKAKAQQEDAKKQKKKKKKKKGIAQQRGIHFHQNPQHGGLIQVQACLSLMLRSSIYFRGSVGTFTCIWSVTTQSGLKFLRRWCVS